MGLETTTPQTSTLGFQPDPPGGNADDESTASKFDAPRGPKRHKTEADSIRSGSWLRAAAVGSAAALGAAAVYNIIRAKEAERAHPPIGRFLEVDGVRAALH